MRAKDKFIAFVDILGFSDLVEAAERNGGGDFSRLLELAQVLGSPADANRFRQSGPKICPHSGYVARDLDFQVTQIADCVVVSAEVSPAAIMNLAHYCFGISVKLLSKGALCRGVVTRGNIHHSEGQFIGTGYMRAYRDERHVAFLRTEKTEKGTPFIQVDDAIAEYVRDETDECVRKMFARITRSDGTYTAIYPFGVLSNAPAAFIGPDFDPLHWKAAVQRSIGYRQADLAAFECAEQRGTTENAKLKIRHYKRGLEEVIERLRVKEAVLDQMITTGHIPYGTVWK